MIYRTQLEKIAEYFLEHPEKELEHPFNFLFKEIQMQELIINYLTKIVVVER
jgi:hypothetical protein